MTAYFNAALNADQNLLPPGLRSNVELANIAALAEAAVIGYYTSNPPYYLYTTFMNYVVNDSSQGVGALGMLQYVERGLGEDISATGQPSTAIVANLRVYLTGYKADASSSSVDPNLKAALRLTIARVIRWMLEGWGREPGVASTSSSIENKARTYRENADDFFPRDWNMLLIPFDSKPMPWGL